MNKSIDLIDIKKNSHRTKKIYKNFLKSRIVTKSLFNKRAQLLKKLNLNLNLLEENDFKKLLLTHYSFLKRPVLLFNGKIYIGNSKKNVEDAEIELSKK